MKIRELIDQLTKLIAADEFRAEATVTFGPEREPVEGGLLGRGDGGLVELNLAPIKLDKIGGF